MQDTRPNAKLSYTKWVRQLADIWVELRCLSCFLDKDLGVSVNIPGQSKGTEPKTLERIRASRATKLDMVVFDVFEDGNSFKTRDERLQNLTESTGGAESLETLLLKFSDPAPKLRLILVEDLSCETIEQLGTTFILNANVFADHLRGIQMSFTDNKDGSTGWSPPAISDRARSPRNPLSLSLEQRSLFSFDISRKYIKEEGKDFRKEDSVIVRHMQVLEDGITHRVTGKITIYKFVHNDTPTVLYLFDPLPNWDFQPGSEGSWRFESLPLYPNPAKARERKRSSRDELLGHLKDMQPATLDSMVKTHGSAANFFLVQLALSKWSHIAAGADQAIAQHEASISDGGGQGILLEQKSRQALHMRIERMRNRHYLLRHQLFTSLMTMELLITRWDPFSEATSMQWQALELDFQRLKRDLDMWDSRALGLQQTILSMMHLDETRLQAQLHGHLARLTILGFFFVPMTFIATIFGIEDTRAQSKEFILSLVLVEIATITMGFLSVRFKNWISHKKSPFSWTAPFRSNRVAQKGEAMTV